MHKILNNKTKKYDNIILLGETCETGWQYTRNIGDPESNLFNWVRINNKNRFLEALKNPDIITKGEIEKNYDWGMFTDYNSGCVFHSTKHAEEMQYEDGSYNEEMWEEELVKLKSRNSHMIEKLKNICKNDESKLFIYKAQECNIEKREEYYDFFTKLYEILKAKTNNNFDLLIIVLQKDYEFFNSKFDEEYKNLYIRTLKKFTPGGQAVSEELSDNYGWKLIYEEFSPKRFHKGKKYKFDSNENKGNESMNYLEKIFSVKNENYHKIFTIFGIRMKFTNSNKALLCLKDEISGMKNETSYLKNEIVNLKDETSYLKNGIVNLNKSEECIVQNIKNITCKRKLLWDGIMDSAPESFKTFVLKNNMPIMIEKLKMNLDDKSLKVVNNTLDKMLQLPDYKYSKFLYVDDNEYRSNFETEADKEFKKLYDNYYMTVKNQYKLARDDYDMEVFIYHHGLKFASDKIKEYVKGKDFIDAGAYIGDSALVFMGYKPNKIYSFEISDKSIKSYKETMEINNISQDKYEIVRKALSDKTDDVLVSDDGGMSVKIYSKDGNKIETVTLDSFLEGKNTNIGFIKADIEGAMYRALCGMRQTIQKYRPVLSFAIYHSPEEFFYTKPLLDEITQNLNYKITIDCHYSSCYHIYGTIIWAYPAELV